MASLSGVLRVICVLTAVAILPLRLYAETSTAGTADQGSDATYPDGGMRLIGHTDYPETGIYTGFLDSNAGYTYYAMQNSGDFSQPSTLIKMALGTGSEPPHRIGAVQVPGRVSLDPDGFVDTQGYLYYAFSGDVAKIALGSGDALPRFIGKVSFTTTVGKIEIVARDTSTTLAYALSTSNAASRLYRLNPGTGDELPTLGAFIDIPASTSLVLVDSSTHYAYISTSSGLLHKVKLGSESGADELISSTNIANPGETGFGRICLDQVSGRAFWATSTPKQVIQLNLGEGDDPPARTGSVATLSPNILMADSHHGYIYAASGSQIEKFAEDIAGGNPESVGTLKIDSSIPLIDSEGDYIYALTANGLSKLATGVDAELPFKVGTGRFELMGAVYFGDIDTVHGYAYLGYISDMLKPPPGIYKIAMGIGDAPPRHVSTLDLPSASQWVLSVLLDPDHGYGYFNLNGLNGTPDRTLLKARLGDGDEAPRVVSELKIPMGIASVIDPDAGYAYYQSPNGICKIRLEEGDTTPTLVALVPTPWVAGDCAGIDPVEGYFFVSPNYKETGASQYIRRIAKYSLGDGDTTPTLLGVTVSDAGSSLDPSQAFIDPVTHYAFLISVSSGTIRKVYLGIGDEPPGDLVAAADSQESFVGSGFDPTTGYGYIASATDVSKYDMRTGESAPRFLGTLRIQTPSTPFPSTRLLLADSAHGQLLSSVYNSFKGSIAIKVATSKNAGLHATRFTVPEDGNLRDVRFYSHGAGGTIRLAIYDDAETKTLVWESQQLANDDDETTITASVISGDPSSLKLAAGNYWLAWQTDSFSNVAGLIQDLGAQSFTFDQPYGAAATALSANQITVTDGSGWSGFITYFNKDGIIRAILGIDSSGIELDLNGDSAVDAADAAE
ncbi:hypothetical protein BH09SUM1_BH09SUM1_21070 [soil metagenome]